MELSRNWLQKLNNYVAKQVLIHAELIGLLSVIFLFSGLAISYLSFYTWPFILTFWTPLGILIAYLAGMIAGYAYFAMYEFRLRRPKK